MGSGTEIAVIEPNDSTDVAPRDAVAGLLRPVAAPADVLRAQNETRELVRQVLQKGRDYGRIPGTDKDVLYKAGAERTCNGFGCAPRYKVLEKEVDHFREVDWTKRKKEWSGPKGNRRFKWVTESGTSQGLYRYVVECELVHRASGVVVGQGIGSCSTLESKYIDRPRDSENTALKMASKRAFLAATLNAFGLSDQFTQDVEDMQPEEDVGPRSPDPEPERASAGDIDIIRQLLPGAAISEKKRKETEAWLADGITPEDAQKCIQWLREKTPAECDDEGQDQNRKEHPAAKQAREVYEKALEEHRVDLIYDKVALAKFEEETIGRTSSEDWLASEYLRAAAAVEQSEAPETDDSEAA